MALDIQRFSHVVMQVGDIEASVAFYRDLLGLEVLFDRPYVDPRRPDREQRAVGLATGGGVSFELMGDPARPREIDGSGAPVLALSVADLDAADRALRAAGVEPIMPPREMEPGVIMLFLADPDGRTIELVQFPDGLQTSEAFARR